MLSAKIKVVFADLDVNNHHWNANKNYNNKMNVHVHREQTTRVIQKARIFIFCNVWVKVK